MSQYIQLSDPEFKQTLTLQEAYLTMFQFLVSYHKRGECSTGSLLGDIQIEITHDQTSADPAQLYDFLDAFKAIKKYQKDR